MCNLLKPQRWGLRMVLPSHSQLNSKHILYQLHTTALWATSRSAGAAVLSLHVWHLCVTCSVCVCVCAMPDCASSPSCISLLIAWGPVHCLWLLVMHRSAKWMHCSAKLIHCSAKLIHCSAKWIHRSAKWIHRSAKWLHCSAKLILCSAKLLHRSAKWIHRSAKWIHRSAK